MRHVRNQAFIKGGLWQMKTTKEELLAKAEKPAQDAMKMHPYYRGKIEVMPKCAIRDVNDFSIWYTPGVAEPCREIRAEPASGLRTDEQGQHGSGRHRRHAGARPRRHRPPGRPCPSWKERPCSSSTWAGSTPSLSVSTSRTPRSSSRR